MSRRSFLWLLGLGLVVAVLVLMSSPVPVDTRIRLEREGAAPFDAEVFFEALPGWIDADVTPTGRPAFDVLEDSTLRNTTYLFLTPEFLPGEAESDRLLAFVERGNTLMVAATYVEGPFFDALSSPDTTQPLLGVYDVVDFLGTGQLGVDDTLRLVSPGVAGAYGFPVGVSMSEIYGLDPERSEILGLSDGESFVTLATVRYGDGTVLLSSTPLAFSNAALTGPGDAEAYVSAVLASLPRQPILWDDYRKPFRQQGQTPLRYVLGSPGLAGAFWLLVSLFMLYVLFRGRRWQRAIPVVAAPPNAQREFARTVGRLHFTHGDTARLAERTIRLFLDRLRTRLRLVEPDLSERTAQLAARRAGVPVTEGVALFARLRRLQKTSSPAAADLVDLDARLDRFFRFVTADGSPADPPADTARQRDEAELIASDA